MRVNNKSKNDPFASGSFVMNVANVALKEHAARVCARGLASEAPSHAS